MDAQHLTTDLPARVDALPWAEIGRELDTHGCALVPRLLDAETCAAAAAWYDRDALFRSRVIMARHGFGRGEYRYFAYPLPDLVAGMREAFWPHLSAIANRWGQTLGLEARWPARHADFLARCHAAGQTRPTPLLLRYGPGDTIACTRTSMASTSSRCSSRSCCRSPAATSKAASSCSPSNGRGCSRAPRSCRCARATR